MSIIAPSKIISYKLHIKFFIKKNFVVVKMKAQQVVVPSRFLTPLKAMFNVIKWGVTMTETELVEIAEEKDWGWLSTFQKLSEPFIEKYKDKVHWEYISRHQKLSEPFIEKYKDRVDWHSVSMHQKLSEQFIEKYKDKVDWELISGYQTLSEAIIEKYKDKMNWYYISQNQSLSYKFMLKYKAKIKWDHAKLDPIDKIILLSKIKDERIRKKLMEQQR
jgi:ADP-dependent phosphofructokinase/glucokinase